MRIHLVLRNMYKVLNVAEKNDAAKNIAGVMSNGSNGKVSCLSLKKVLIQSSQWIFLFFYSEKVTQNLIRFMNFLIV